MGIKIYISGISGNKEVKKRQQRVLLILDSKNVKYEVIDIAEPGAEEAKDFMQNNSTSLGATIGDPSPRHALPPQIFNDDVYCGDYDMFDMANEIDEMEVFLKLEPNSLNEQNFSFETKLKNGDLSIDEKIDKVVGAKINDEEIKQSEQDKVQDDDKVENENDNTKEGSVEKEDNNEGSPEKKEENKDENAEKEEESKEKEIGKDEENKEVDIENKSEENEKEDRDAAGDKTDENGEDKEDNEKKEELDKEASPKKEASPEKEELEKEASPEKSE